MFNGHFLKIELLKPQFFYYSFGERIILVNQSKKRATGVDTEGHKELFSNRIVLIPENTVPAAEITSYLSAGAVGIGGRGKIVADPHNFVSINIIFVKHLARSITCITLDPSGLAMLAGNAFVIITAAIVATVAIATTACIVIATCTRSRFM